MKSILRNSLPLFLFTSYALIACGSGEHIGTGLLVILIVAVVIFMVFAIVGSAQSASMRKEGLERAVEKFGHYTEKAEYMLGEYILYDATSNRLKLKNAIVDSKKIREIKTAEKDPEVKTTYKQELVTKTNTGSTVGRALVGGVLLGPAGAVIGGATAKKKTVMEKTPDRTIVIPGRYTIDVYDDKGDLRCSFDTSDKTYHCNVKGLLNKIIEENTRTERKLMQEEADKQQLLLEGHMSMIQATDVNALRVGEKRSVFSNLLLESDVDEQENGAQYKLCAQAIETINQGLGTHFDRIRLIIKDDLLVKLDGVSIAYTAGKFNNLIADINQIADNVSQKYGEPSSSKNIAYTSLTEDNPSLDAYEWSRDEEFVHRVGVLIEDGNYKYQLSSEKLSKNNRMS